MKVVIAGGNGFIGSHLSEFLSAQEIYTISLVRNSQTFGLQHTQNPFHNYFYFTKLEEIEVLLLKDHFDFFLNPVTKYNHQNNNDYMIEATNGNIIFLAHLVNLCSKHGIPLISFGTYLQELPGAERSSSFYVYTKKFASEFLNKSSQFSSLKYFEFILNDTYGEKDTRDKIIYKILRSTSGARLLATEGYQLINLLYIDDVCEGVLIALNQLQDERLKFNQSVGIRSNDFIQLRELVKKCELVTGRHANISWGAITYRESDIFKPPSLTPILETWSQKISLEQGISKVASTILGSMKSKE